MKLAALITLLFCVTLSSCTQGLMEKFDLTQIPQDWTHLTETDTGLVIYSSCDAGNLLISIKHNSEILFHGQQEDEVFEIIEVLKTKNDTIKINTHLKGTTELQTFNFQWEDRKKGIIKMVSASPVPIAVGFVFIDHKSERTFPIFNQPCKDCWPEEECE